jgi:N-methylhydantoinase B
MSDHATHESLDPVTFEVLRHKLWQANDEAGHTIRLVSGSPIATEAYDFNTGISDANGDLLFIGPYVVLQAAVQSPIVKNIVRDYPENPGINPDDMFICSDPYFGALHQNDVTCVAPVHCDGQLIAWAAATIHQVDVGGPVPGGYAVGAHDIFQEPPPIPPLKIVERGTIRKDIEREYLRRSRQPYLLGLDLRAMIAANNAVKSRIQQLAQEFGVATLLLLFRSLKDYAETRFRARLRELPDGTWRHIAFLDHDGLEDKIYRGVLEMTKENDTLTFDFNQSSAQAPALINCALSGLHGGVLNAVLPLLCFDIPWAAGGISNAIRVLCETGKIYNASWPAGVCMGSVEAARSVLNLASVCIGKMLAASEKYREFSMASWCVPGAQILFGTDQRGAPFGTMLLDSMAGGGGARSVADGLDSGSYLSSMDKIIPNVEMNEYLFPILYLYRKTSPDSGGAGKYRGGTGGEHAFVAHDTDKQIQTVFFSHGTEQPESVGLSGGHPGSTNQWAIVRDSNLPQLLANGTIPTSWRYLEGAVEHPSAKSTFYLRGSDVSVAIYSGGGGYGDPLDRDPEKVRNDVSQGSVSIDAARSIYGVVVREDKSIDHPATRTRREELRASHKTQKRKPFAGTGTPISEHLVLCSAQEHQESVICCVHCGHEFGPPDRNPKLQALLVELPLRQVEWIANPYNRMHDRFVWREFYCPGCSALFDVEIMLRDMPPLFDAQLRATPPHSDKK